MLRLLAPWGAVDLVQVHLFDDKSKPTRCLTDVWALPGGWSGTWEEIRRLCSQRGPGWAVIDVEWNRARRAARRRDDNWTRSAGVSTAYKGLPVQPLAV